MTLDDRTKRLIAVGASITANCQPCLEINVSKALEKGAGRKEIAEAIEIGKLVRHGAASKMDRFISQLEDSATASAATPGCGCTAPEGL